MPPCTSAPAMGCPSFVTTIPFSGRSFCAEIADASVSAIASDTGSCRKRAERCGVECGCFTGSRRIMPVRAGGKGRKTRGGDYRVDRLGCGGYYRRTSGNCTLGGQSNEKFIGGGCVFGARCIGAGGFGAGADFVLPLLVQSGRAERSAVGDDLLERSVREHAGGGNDCLGLVQVCRLNLSRRQRTQER